VVYVRYYYTAVQRLSRTSRYYLGGEGIFIRLESSGRPAKVAYIWYYYTAVQRLSRTSRYYRWDIPKSSERLVLLGVCPLYYSQSIVYYLSMEDHCTSALQTSGVPAYVRTKRQEYMFANPSIYLVQKSSFPKCPSDRS
jgi:hypothetical protein